MAEILLILTLLMGEKNEFLNGIVSVVNADVITSRDVEIFLSLKEYEGLKLEKEEALNQLIEESIVFQSAEGHGIEPEVSLVTQCVKKINYLVKEKKSELVEKLGYTERDTEKRCLRTETMKLFIENKFLKPVIVQTGKFSEKHLEEYQEIAINDYKIWLNDIIQKFQIEKFLENLNKKTVERKIGE